MHLVGEPSPLLSGAKPERGEAVLANLGIGWCGYPWPIGPPHHPPRSFGVWEILVLWAAQLHHRKLLPAPVAPAARERKDRSSQLHLSYPPPSMVERLSIRGGVVFDGYLVSTSVA